MYPTKSYNEIQKIIENEAIFCFSIFMNIKDNKKNIEFSLKRYEL